MQLLVARPELTGDDEYENGKPDAGESLEQTRHNYTMQAHMDESDDRSVAGLIVNTSGHRKSGGASSKKKAESVSDFLLLHELSLAEFENHMEGKYGEDFDLLFAADFLDAETHEALARIQDKEQRREAVSVALQEGINNGKISREDIDAANPGFGRWIDSRTEARLDRVRAANPKSDVDIRQDNELTESVAEAFGPLGPPSS